jgi:hypothetical protein
MIRQRSHIGFTDARTFIGPFAGRIQLQIEEALQPQESGCGYQQTAFRPTWNGSKGARGAHAWLMPASQTHERRTAPEAGPFGKRSLDRGS